MPGVDFEVVRSSVSMRQVLDWLGLEPSETSGNQWRGPCPLHGSSRAESRSFSVNIDFHRYQCFRCRSSGNPIEMWAAAKALSVYDAAIDLCGKANLSVPWITRW
jgi:DNA primase